MEYFTLLNLKKEPFSNSPDPEMFYQSGQHKGCLQKLELAIRLKRGLSVVIGDIGTGKSTLCRRLVRTLNSEEYKIQSHLILDPEFTSPIEFLTTITKTFGLSEIPDQPSEWQLKDAFKNYLFDQAVKNKKLLVLIIDEGQKLPDFCVEILREFLNYETNQQKLLQIAIFAQKEFQLILENKANFADRIAAFHQLSPLSYSDTREMILYRLKKARKQTSPKPNIFSPMAVLAIYLKTGGYPRKIVMICSKVILSILVKNRTKAGVLDVLKLARQSNALEQGKSSKALSAFIAIVLIGGILFYGYSMIPTKKIPVRKHSQNVPPTITTEPSTPPLRASQLTEPSPQPSSKKIPVDIPEKGATELGSIQFDQQTTLSKMISRVYGRFSNLRLKNVLDANPQITDPDHILQGTMIHFPSISDETPESTPLGSVIAVKNTLSEAYEITKQYSQDENIVIYPKVSQGKERLFTVYLEEPKENLKAEARQEIPEIIGTLKFENKSILSKMISRVYGRYTNSRLANILAVNPQITNPNHITVGTFINFPRQTTGNFSPGQNNNWIALIEDINFPKAYKIVKDYPDKNTPVRLSAYMGREKGLQFRVVIEQFFNSPESAQNALAKIPAEFKDSAVIKTGL